MEKRNVKMEERRTKKTRWERPVLVKLGDADRANGQLECNGHGSADLR